MSIVKNNAPHLSESINKKVDSIERQVLIRCVVLLATFLMCYFPASVMFIAEMIMGAHVSIEVDYILLVPVTIFDGAVTTIVLIVSYQKFRDSVYRHVLSRNISYQSDEQYRKFMIQGFDKTISNLIVR
jgi:hypothetical protein